MGFPNADFVDEDGTSKVKYCKIGTHSELDTKKNDFLKLMVEPSILTATEKTFQCKNWPQTLEYFKKHVSSSQR